MTSLSSLWRDARIACRSLAKQPAFSLMSIGILALGIAGTMMVFGPFDGLFLRPFPVPEQASEDLIHVHKAMIAEDLADTATSPPGARRELIPWRS